MNSNLASQLAGEYAMRKLEAVEAKSKLERQSSIRQVSASDDFIPIPTKRIGRGGYGSVFRVALPSEPPPSTSCPPPTAETSVVSEQQRQQQIQYYAMKCLDPAIRFAATPYHMAASDLVREGDLLSRLNHPNIIQLHAVSNGPISRSFLDHDMGYFLILDLLKKDTLRHRISCWRYLDKQQYKHKQQTTSMLLSHRAFVKLRRRHTGATVCSSAARGPPSLLERIETVAMKIARGMEYLHSQNVVHRDLKPDNIGFDSNTNELKIFDFGFARELHTLNTTEIAGTLHYQSPEALVGNNSGLPSDVYSFGILLWELVTLKKVHKQVDRRGRSTTKGHYKHLIINRKWRPSLKSVASLQLRSLISNCWDDNPSKRPTFTQISDELQSFINGDVTRRLSSLSLELEGSGESQYHDAQQQPEGDDDQDHQDQIIPLTNGKMKHRRLRSMFLLRTSHDNDAEKKAKKRCDDLIHYAGVSPKSHTTATISTDSISV